MATRSRGSRATGDNAFSGRTCRRGTRTRSAFISSHILKEVGPQMRLLSPFQIELIDALPHCRIARSSTGNSFGWNRSHRFRRAPNKK
jgi:hypothetical protein